MTDNNFSIKIGTQKNIRPTGQQVTQATWSPEAGLAREKEIAEARAKALNDHRKQVEDATTVGQRLITLENKVGQIEADIQKLLTLLGAQNVQA